MPTQSGYDLKVIDEATTEGLPMYRVGTGAAAPPPTPAITTHRRCDRAAVRTVQRHADLHAGRRRRSAGTTRSDDAFAENRRPIEPTTKLDVTQPGLVAHGALLTARDLDGRAELRRSVQPGRRGLVGLNARARRRRQLPDEAAVDRLARARPPARVSGSSSSAGSSGATATPEAQGIGTQRRFTALSGNVLYTAPNVTDFTPSSFGPVEVTKAAYTVGFAVDVTDNVGGANGVKRVLVALPGRQRSLEVDRDVARHVSLERRRNTGRQLRRVVHPGRRRRRQRFA